MYKATTKYFMILGRLFFAPIAGFARIMLLWLALGMVSAFGHNLPPTEVDVTFEGNLLHLDIPLVLEELIADLSVQLDPDVDTMAVADLFDHLVASEGAVVIEAFDPYADSFIHDFRILDGDQSFQANITQIDVPAPNPNGAPRETIIHAVARIPANIATVQIGWGEENGDLAIVDTANGELDYLIQGQLSRPITRDGTTRTSVNPLEYIHLGFIHIVPRGLDHILFVLGLFFYTFAWRKMLLQATAFTVAHSITLALAALGLVTVSSAIVEPLIALSIAYVAFENVFARKTTISPLRLSVIFAFGLLHGLGFASVLLDLTQSSAGLLGQIIFFNIGVELGQIAVLAVAFVLIALPFGRWSGYNRYIADPASFAIGLVGIYWTITRVF